ncbi:MAG TPA: lysylphosphatidylglycerol synthase transmembrane domain-containing protein [Baekduia sp.]|nr:lysylphosphatidylglycerol synthase transmembrane domain-containing protein [Baekduia sp.]
MINLFAAVVQRFGQVDARLAALALCFHVANHVLRSVAWRNVLAAAYPNRRVRLLDIGAAYAIGVALNAVLPGRGGDAAKVVLARTRVPGSTVPTIAATMSVIVLFDMVAATLLVLVVGLTGAVAFSPRLPSPSATAVIAGVVAVGIAVAAALVAPRLAVRLRTLRQHVAQGGAILKTPRRYARQVVLVQAGAWTCRIAVVFFLLAAFGLPASLPTAGLVMVVAGLSTLVPLTPGGAGTQQVMLAYALHQTVAAAAAVSFSLGMQAGITVVNALLGVAAAMVVFRTVRPLAAVRSGLGLLGARDPA